MTRLISATQFHALEHAIPEFGHWRIVKQIVRPDDMLYTDWMHFPAVDGIMEKCGLYQIAYDLRLLPDLRGLAWGPGMKSDRKIIEIWYDENIHREQLTGVRYDYRVRLSDILRGSVPYRNRFAIFGWL